MSAYEQGCEDTIERIANELTRLADSYIENAFEGNIYDIWTWTGKLADRIRAGEFTQPLNTEPPF